uniref:Transmembrane 9 superfamily member n=1 Tax=Pinguiococcus pyrenoidosus TaxID=172671 RepID=A0A7R9YFF3_9STRA|mmetsp:Transcript_6596/g.25458  ORF Transcript_6596/g.25458 Transcript_6596/m.25458 type:complete len:625 (+) Transcript_6596:124-1998(+)
MRALAWLTLLTFERTNAASFYLPGMRPRSYKDSGSVKLNVNKLTSTKTQLPYEYYDLPMCKPQHKKHNSETLGQVLSADRITSSDYELKMKEDAQCKKLCTMDYDEADAKKFRDIIDNEYLAHWLVDDLPVAYRMDTKGGEYSFLVRGFPIGFVTPTEHEIHYLYNHHIITVNYHEDPEHFEGARVVGVEVDVRSVKHQLDAEGNVVTCEGLNSNAAEQQFNFQSVEEPGQVTWTYDVKWVPSARPWSRRWEVFLRASLNNKLHFFSIINSLMIVVFLGGIVALIVLRMLRRDISEYNDADDDQAEQGWKNVHGDVFRAPPYPMLLSVSIGTGVQLIVVVTCTLVFALLGFLSPANRGGLIQCGVFCFFLSGIFAGYTSSRYFKFFQGKNWKRNTLLTGVLYPSMLAVVCLILEIMVHSEGSSAAVPISTIFKLLALWLGLSLPLVFVGSYFGLKEETYEVPCRTKMIQRVVPPASWYNSPAFTIFVGGLLCFGAICIEFFFIMTAVWQHQIYYIFGFLFVVMLILGATCAEVGIVMCYFQLCAEDWRWWWRSFMTCASSGGFLFAYAIWYFINKLRIEGAVSSAVYFGYMLVVSGAFALLTGTISFLSCFTFVRSIFGSIKVD